MKKEPKTVRMRALSGLIWSSIERFCQIGCTFIVQIILARLLLPEQFGIIAMVTVFIGISQALIDSGFANAIIQKPNVENVDISTIFQFNIIIGLLVAILLWIVAPAISIFYDESEIKPILRWLSISLIIGSVGGVHNALLIRGLKFKKILKMSLPATFVSGCVAIGMAWAGLGVWALVGQVIIQQLFRTVLLWCQSDWRPRDRFSWTRFKIMFPYSSKLAISNILDQGFQNIYVLVIGKLYSPLTVGYYHRAKLFQQLPIINLQYVLGRVLFPTIANVQSDPRSVRKIMKIALQVSVFIIFTMMAFMAAMATPLILLLIGSKWLPIIDILKPLCLVGCLFPLHIINQNMMKGMGRSDIFLKMEIIKKILIVINILITYRFGLISMVYGMFFVGFFSYIFSANYANKLIGYGFYSQIKDIFPAVLISGLVWISLQVFVEVIDISSFGLLFLGAGIVYLINKIFLPLIAKNQKNQMIIIFKEVAPRKLHWFSSII